MRNGRTITYASATWAFLVLAALSFPIADLAVTALHPGAELWRLLSGIIRPDITAVGALHALNALGIAVPETIAVTGCDGIEEGEFQTPSLTTIIQPIEEMCR